MVFAGDLTDRERTAMWRAQLADMPLDVISAYLAERGLSVGVVPDRIWQDRRGALRVRDRLPPGYPSLADADVPFDGERDGR